MINKLKKFFTFFLTFLFFFIFANNKDLNAISPDDYEGEIIVEEGMEYYIYDVDDDYFAMVLGFYQDENNLLSYDELFSSLNYEFTIPNSINHNDVDYEIISISDEAFKNVFRSNIIDYYFRLTFNDHIYSIGSNSFEGADNLDIINPQPCVETIGEEAFLDSGDWSSLGLFGPDISEIGPNAFGNTNLDLLIINQSSLTINFDTFSTSNIKKLIIDLDSDKEFIIKGYNNIFEEGEDVRFFGTTEKVLFNNLDSSNFYVIPSLGGSKVSIEDQEVTIVPLFNEKLESISLDLNINTLIFRKFLKTSENEFIDFDKISLIFLNNFTDEIILKEIIGFGHWLTIEKIYIQNNAIPFDGRTIGPSSSSVVGLLNSSNTIIYLGENFNNDKINSVKLYFKNSDSKIISEKIYVYQRLNLKENQKNFFHLDINEVSIRHEIYLIETDENNFVSFINPANIDNSTFSNLSVGHSLFLDLEYSDSFQFFTIDLKFFNSSSNWSAESIVNWEDIINKYSSIEYIYEINMKEFDIDVSFKIMEKDEFDELFYLINLTEDKELGMNNLDISDFNFSYSFDFQNESMIYVYNLEDLNFFENINDLFYFYKLDKTPELIISEFFNNDSISKKDDLILTFELKEFVFVFDFGFEDKSINFTINSDETFFEEGSINDISDNYDIIPTKQGYTFLGWTPMKNSGLNLYHNLADKIIFDNISYFKGVKENITLYAIWEPETFSISYQYYVLTEKITPSNLEEISHLTAFENYNIHTYNYYMDDVIVFQKIVNLNNEYVFIKWIIDEVEYNILTLQQIIGLNKGNVKIDVVFSKSELELVFLKEKFLNHEPFFSYFTGVGAILDKNVIKDYIFSRKNQTFTHWEDENGVILDLSNPILTGNTYYPVGVYKNIKLTLGEKEFIERGENIIVNKEYEYLYNFFKKNNYEITRIYYINTANNKEVELKDYSEYRLLFIEDLKILCDYKEKTYYITIKKDASHEEVIEIKYLENINSLPILTHYDSDMKFIGWYYFDSNDEKVFVENEQIFEFSSNLELFAEWEDLSIERERKERIVIIVIVSVAATLVVIILIVTISIFLTKKKKNIDVVDNELKEEKPSKNKSKKNKEVIDKEKVEKSPSKNKKKE